jgi:hypothetical protein
VKLGGTDLAPRMRDAVAPAARFGRLPVAEVLLGE